MSDSYEDPNLAAIGAEVAEKAKTFGDGLNADELPDPSTQPAYDAQDVQEVASYGGGSAEETDQSGVSAISRDLQTKAVVSEGSSDPYGVDSPETSLAEIGEQVVAKAKTFGDGLDASELPDPSTQPAYNPDEVKDALTPDA